MKEEKENVFYIAFNSNIVVEVKLHKNLTGTVVHCVQVVIFYH